eukprot:TRINITY_DN22065_c0_g1_i1.p1 TRINITY_DN22065_c0_g1~~TRINITY_DN22065_c0_g1_i1.p1  ORF type:complete len:290 (-),score=38.83 TRINITY_DN22065_c0_g1_i1:531-1400(-)
MRGAALRLAGLFGVACCAPLPHSSILQDAQLQQTAMARLESAACGPLLSVAQVLLPSKFGSDLGVVEAPLDEIQRTLGALVHEQGLGDGDVLWTSLRDGADLRELVAQLRSSTLSNASQLELIFQAARPGLVSQIVAELSDVNLTANLLINQTLPWVEQAGTEALALLAHRLPQMALMDKLKFVVATLEPVIAKEAYSRGVSWADVLSFGMRLAPSLPVADRLVMFAYILVPRIVRVALALSVFLVLGVSAARTTTQRTSVMLAIFAVFFALPSPIFEMGLAFTLAAVA